MSKAGKERAYIWAVEFWDQDRWTWAGVAGHTRQEAREIKQNLEEKTWVSIRRMYNHSTGWRLIDGR